jgi:hypothetical protein
VRYFAVSGDSADLKKALASYKKSESFGGKINPDLYFNKGNIERYLMQFSLSSESYERAKMLDPTLNGVDSCLDEIKGFLTRVN